MNNLHVLTEPLAVEVPGMKSASRRNRTLEAGTFLVGVPFCDGRRWMLSFNDSGLWFDAWAETEPKTELA